MSSNNAVILHKAQTYGPIVNGETMEFVKRPYEYNNLQDGDIVVQTMCLSADPYMVPSPSHSLFSPFREAKSAIHQLNHTHQSEPRRNIVSDYRRTKWENQSQVEESAGSTNL